jgi:hypothetical protein
MHLKPSSHSGRIVGYTEVIHDGHVRISTRKSACIHRFCPYHEPSENKRLLLDCRQFTLNS